MKKSLLSLLLLTALPTALSAQEETPVRKREPFVRQHELRLTVGAYPLMPYLAGSGCDAEHAFGFDRTHRGPVYTSGAWSLSYDYRFKKWFDLGLMLGYYGEYSTSYNNRNPSLTNRNRAHYLTIMPVARFTWVNTRWVRMYSALGLGATVGFGHDAYEGTRLHDATLALQCTPVGIAVGRSLFGFAEVGLGAQGVLMMGVGYKFKPKNKLTK
ncbi:MAG: hypothetical protein K2I32_05310 [Alistipes sp.]|nr:hypothetical protein [Alistipes sp.]